MTQHGTAEAIEAGIRSTQSRIDATIDTIKARLSPAELLDQGLDFVKTHGGEIGQNAARKVTENPLPVALMASALAWLIIADGRSKGPSQPAANDTHWNIAPDSREHRETISLHERVTAAAADVRHGTGETLESFNERMHDARASAMGLVREAGEEVSAFRDRVTAGFADLSHRAARARDEMKEPLASMGERASHAAGAARHMAEETSERIGAKAQDLFASQPLVVGALGVALGALAGALLPRTRAEDELLATAGAAVREQASGIATAAVRRAEEAASSIGRAVSEAAATEGLTVEAVKDAASTLARKAESFAETAIDAARNEVESAIR